MNNDKYDKSCRSYEGRAERLLQMDFLKDIFYFGYGIVGRLENDGEWVKLGAVYNVGGKFLHWMVDNNLIERRGNKGPFLDDWYRVKKADDFGDLWVPG